MQTIVDTDKELWTKTDMGSHGRKGSSWNWSADARPFPPEAPQGPSQTNLHGRWAGQEQPGHSWRREGTRSTRGRTVFIYRSQSIAQSKPTDLWTAESPGQTHMHMKTWQVDGQWRAWNYPIKGPETIAHLYGEQDEVVYLPHTERRTKSQGVKNLSVKVKPISEEILQNYMYDLEVGKDFLRPIKH